MPRRLPSILTSAPTPVSGLYKALITASLLCSSAFATELANAQSVVPAASAIMTGDYPEVSESTGRLIVKYRSAEQPWQTPRGSKKFIRQTLRNNLRLTLARKLSDTQELVEATPGHSMAQLKAQARALGALGEVEYASVEYRRYPLLEPDDPLYQGSQAPGNQSYLYQGEYSLHAPGAWDITTGASSSVIAIVDTGILPDHPEIRERSVVNLGYDFVSADRPGDYTSANDGDGRDNNPTDPGDPCNGSSSSWHGTAVASAAAGTSNNAEGLAGIDWNARLLHARALGGCGGTDADIIDAIRWSAGLPVAGIPDNPTPANVVNLSLGGATECTRAWQDVIDELAEQNIVFVMAAGNERLNALRSAPANCANVITVGSSTPDGSVDSGFSNYGLKVTISTAGRDILAASNSGFSSANPEGNIYLTETGTSFSAALVSGAISLMHSLNPDLGPAAVRALLQESATPYATGSSCELFYCGGGVMNLARALTLLSENNFTPGIDTAKQRIENESLEIPLQREVNGTLFGFKDVRYFSIDVPELGLLQAESTSNEDVYGYLLNSELSVIAMDDDAGAATNFRLASLVEPGTYYVAVERESHRTSDGELPFTLQTSLSDDAPAAFSFNPFNTAVGNAVIESNTVTISGLQGQSVLTITDGFYYLNNSPTPDNQPASISNGDTIQVLAQAPGNPGGSTTATVTVGAYSTDFTVTTGDADTASAFDYSGSNSGSNSGCTITSPTRLDPLFLILVLITSAALLRRHMAFAKQ